MRILQSALLCLLSFDLVSPNLAFSNSFRITSSGYSDPSNDKGIVEVTNRESFEIECDIKAIGIARSRSGEGPLKGKVTSLPIKKALKPNRAAELEFDFETALEKMRRRWNDQSAILVELGSANDASIIDPVCKRVGGSEENPGNDRSRYLYEVLSNCDHTISLWLRWYNGREWQTDFFSLEQGDLSERITQRGNSVIYLYATSAIGHEWGGPHEFDVGRETFFFRRKNLQRNTIITERLTCR